MKLVNKILSIKPLLNFGIYSFGTLLNGLINLIMIPIYSNYIAPEEYGILNIIIIITTILTIIIDNGLNMAYSIKYYKVKHLQRSIYLYNVLIYNFFIFVIIALIFIIFPNFLGSFFHISITKSILIKIIIILFLTVISNFFMNLLRLNEEAGNYFIFSIIKTVFLGILNVYFLIYLKQNYVSYLNSIIVSQFILFIFSIAYFLKRYPIKLFQFDRKGLLQLIILGFPLLIGSLLNFFLTSNDKYILKVLTTSAVVGLYSMSYRFGNLIDTFLTNPLGQAISPAAFKNYATDVEKYKVIMRNVLFLYVNLAYCFILLLFTFLDVFYHFFINQMYWSSYHNVVFILFGYFFWGAAALLSATIIVKEKTFISTLLISLCSILNIGLNILLIPKYGAFGASLAILISYIIIFLFYYKITQNLIYINHKWREILILTLFFIICMAGILVFSKFEYFKIINIIIKSLIFIIFMILSYKLNIEKLRNFLKNVKENI